MLQVNLGFVGGAMPVDVVGGGVQVQKDDRKAITGQRSP